MRAEIGKKLTEPCPSENFVFFFGRGQAWAEISISLFGRAEHETKFLSFIRAGLGRDCSQADWVGPGPEKSVPCSPLVSTLCFITLFTRMKYMAIFVGDEHWTQVPQASAQRFPVRATRSSKFIIHYWRDTIQIPLLVNLNLFYLLIENISLWGRLHIKRYINF